MSSGGGAGEVTCGGMAWATGTSSACAGAKHEMSAAAASSPSHEDTEAPADLLSPRQSYLAVMVTGTPGETRAASQLMLLLPRRMQPWETAVPSVPPMFPTP